jgi:hypothetical protein
LDLYLIEDFTPTRSFAATESGGASTRHSFRSREEAIKIHDEAESRHTTFQSEENSSSIQLIGIKTNLMKCSLLLHINIQILMNMPQLYDD